MEYIKNCKYLNEAREKMRLAKLGRKNPHNKEWNNKIRESIGCRRGIRFNTGRTHFKKGNIIINIEEIK